VEDAKDVGDSERCWSVVVECVEVEVAAKDDNIEDNQSDVHEHSQR
jgi:hypothetical protein